MPDVLREHVLLAPRARQQIMQRRKDDKEVVAFLQLSAAGSKSDLQRHQAEQALPCRATFAHENLAPVPRRHTAGEVRRQAK